MAQDIAVQSKYNLPRMKSVERISQLPAVEQTIDYANNLYVRVKDTNTLVRSVLNTAETTVKGAVDMTLPVTSKLEGPIKMMDSLLCTSLDYVETKIPAVKLPLDEMYKNTRDSLYTIPGVKCACQAGEQGVKKAVEIVHGASQFGTQKLKDVKDCLTLPPANSEDRRGFGAVEENSINDINERKEPEVHKGLNSTGNSTGVHLGKVSKSQRHKKPSKKDKNKIKVVMY